MFDAVMAGRLIKPPKMGQTKSGKPMTTALMAVRCEQLDDTALVSVVAFERVAEQLAALERGDAVTVSGPCRPTEWEAGGEIRHGIGLTAMKVMTAYQRRKAAERTQELPRKPGKGKKSHPWADLYGCGDIELEEIDS